MSVGRISGSPLAAYSSDPEVEVALIVMKQAQATENEHHADAVYAKNTMRREGDEQVARMRDAADDELRAAKTGAVCNMAGGALQMGGAMSGGVDPDKASNLSKGARIGGDVLGRSSSALSTMNGGHSAAEHRADAQAAGNRREIAKTDYDEARQHESAARDVQRSTTESLRQSGHEAHEARMTLLRG
jgi:hypothetical protein